MLCSWQGLSGLCWVRRNGRGIYPALCPVPRDSFRISMDPKHSTSNNFQMACTAPWRGLETRGRTRRGFLEGIFHAAGEAEAFPVLTAKKRPKRVSGRQRNQGLCVKALQSLEGTLHLLGAEAGCKRKIFCLWCLWGIHPPTPGQKSLCDNCL